MFIEKEDGIKFNINFTPAPALSPDQISELNAWRRVMYLLELIGRDPTRYGGAGYGNISRRAGLDDPSALIITGTQTGGLPVLDGRHYVAVPACHFEENYVVAAGPVKPSAETMTHGIVYTLDQSVQWVIHAHSPEIWQHRRALELPSTHPEVPYGSVEMTQEVRRLFAQTPVRSKGIFAMDGHTDGVVAFGSTAEQAVTVLVTMLGRAFQL